MPASVAPSDKDDLGSRTGGDMATAVTPTPVTPAPPPPDASPADDLTPPTATTDEKPSVAKKKKKLCVHKQQKAEVAKDKDKDDKDKDDKDKADEKDKAKDDKTDDDRKKSKKSKKHKKKKASKKRRSHDSSSDDSGSDSDSDSETSVASSSSSHSSSSTSSSSSSSSSSDSSDSDSDAEIVRAALRLLLNSRRRSKRKAKKRKAHAKSSKSDEAGSDKKSKRRSKHKEDKEDQKERASVLEYKRVDELWDKEIHDYKITDTVPHSKQDNYSSFIFTVRRVFDYENKYVETLCDIKSTLLKDALNSILGEVKGVSLVEDIPEVDPNMLFNFLPELSAWVEKASSATVEVKEKKESKKPLPPGAPAVLTTEEKKQQIDHVKLIIEYLNKDYETTKNTLYPLLENHMITFDLLWAVLKPGTIMYTTCAGSNEPRAFKLDYATKESSFMRGRWWSIEGKFLEYDGRDGKSKDSSGDDKGGFGWGTVMVDIDYFKGARKIGSLAAYPLPYRKDKDEMREKLVERGKKFVALAGMQYKAHEGLAFMKKKRQYAKVHVTGRIMVDSGTFRRLNPNYVLSAVKSRNNEDEENEEANYFYLDDDSSDDEACSVCDCQEQREKEEEEEEDRQRQAMRVVKDERGKFHVVSKAEEMEKSQKLDVMQIESEGAESKEPEFADDDFLIASPVVLGWAFNEKLWLEFPVNNVKEIQWNESAFDSLVLPDAQKDIVRALVETHTHAKDNGTIDDVIAGKGRGLVAVLHGPPGVGKTLTAEGVAELLRRPLYCVSSGELGTNPAQLEQELNKILEIADVWSAVILLDEADVFLERRSQHDLHRNALVSIFLRLLEYFQGILFLTTNRVDSFDEAFQSRVHVALRYHDLDRKARKQIWTSFLAMVSRGEIVKAAADAAKASASAKALDSVKGLKIAKRVDDASPVEVKDPVLRQVVNEDELEALVKKSLNGRQIKNVVRTAQALARSKNEKLSMKHLKVVLGVTEGFDHDLKGTGQLDSMMSYS